MLIDSTVMSHLWKQITQFFRHLVNFNARAGHSAGRYFFCHKSPAARARELFKPSTDFGSLLVSVEKKIVQFRVLCGARLQDFPSF